MNKTIFNECPECGSSIEFYDDKVHPETGLPGGRYRCKNKECGRDTVWQELKSYTIEEVLERMEK